MRLSLTLIFALATGVASATAADLPMKAPPAPVRAVSWTGCYVGAGAGYGMSNQRREVITPYGGPFATAGVNAAGTQAFALAFVGPPGTVFLPNTTFGGEGWLGTAQVGCDYQFNGNWLIGAFADGDWSSIRGDRDLFGIFRGEQTLRSSWAVGGRVGWLVTPTLLAYVTGGYTEADFSGVDYNTAASAASVGISNPPASFALAIANAPGTVNGAPLHLQSQRYEGFFIGGGTEYAITLVPGLFWKNEYRYADYRNASTNILCTICTTATTPSLVGQSGLAERVHTTVQTIRTELVWRFNWSGPSIAAKY